MILTGQKVYKKSDSFIQLEEQSDDKFDLSELINYIKERSNNVSIYKKNILLRVVRDLEEKTNCIDDHVFKILPHVREEINRLKTGDILDYLYYRYRYDVFPYTREVDAYPPVVQIEPTSICNYRCVFCFQTDSDLTSKNNKHMGQMSLPLFKNIIDDIEGNVQGVTLASRGEPLINKNICEMLEYIKGKFLATKINTNASLLNDKNIHALLSSDLNTIVFSADAATSDLYKKLRVNGDFEKVVNNIKRFSSIKEKEYPKNKSIIRVSGVLYDNKQNIDDMKKIWGDLVDQVAFVDYCPWTNVYKSKINNITKPCTDLWRRMFVWWDGRCNPCDADYLSTLCVGRYPVNTITKIWTGNKYDKLRQTHLGGNRKCKNVCSKCSVV